MKDSKTKDFLKLVGIPFRFQNKTLAEFTNSEYALMKVRQYLLSLPHQFENGKGLYIHGVSGSGKSHLLYVVAMEILNFKKTVRCAPFQKVVDLYAEKWAGGDEKNYQLLVYKPKALAIDNLGIEHLANTNGKVPLPISVLRDVLSYRLAQNKLTFFASTLSPKEVSTRYGTDIASMLNEACNIVRIDGADMR